MRRAMARLGLAAAVIGASLLVAGAVLAQADQARIVEAAGLHAAPDAGSRVLRRLAQDTAVAEQNRRGGWIQVRAQDDQSGWVRVWKVRAVESGEGLLGALKRFGRKVTGLFSSDRAQGDGDKSVTATIGVRGLRADDDAGDGGGAPLGGAPAAVDRLRELRSYAVDADTARAFARRAGLRSRPGIRTPGAGVSEAEEWDGW